MGRLSTTECTYLPTYLVSQGKVLSPGNEGFMALNV